MKRMKKLLAILLVFALGMALWGCNKKDTDKTLWIRTVNSQQNRFMTRSRHIIYLMLTRMAS